jgi:hypothetical protein
MHKVYFFLFFICAACVNHEFAPFVNCSTSGLEIKIVSLVPATDCDSGDGTVTFAAKGGKKPYSFSSDDVTWSADSTVRNLKSGMYTFRLSDANGCTVEIDTSIIMLDLFPGTLHVIPDSECIENNGSITFELNGSSGGFMYRLDDGAFADVGLFLGVEEGTHTLQVMNGNGCTTITTVVVPRTNTNISWQNEILPIMKASCATSGCHDGVSRRDWRNYNEVKLNAEAIKRKTRDRSMPFDKTLPDDDIDKISCWVDDGALNN